MGEIAHFLFRALEHVSNEMNLHVLAYGIKQVIKRKSLCQYL